MGAIPSILVCRVPRAPGLTRLILPSLSCGVREHRRSISPHALPILVATGEPQANALQDRTVLPL